MGVKTTQREAAATTTADLAGTRVLVATLGSVAEPRGGMQARTRLAVELLDGLGAKVTVVSTTEPPGAAPTWAASLDAPPPDRWGRVSPRLVQLLHRAARGCDAVVLSDPTLLPALAAARVHLPIVWDTNECQSLHFARLPPTARNRAQRLAWLAFERWAAHRCAVAVAIGQVEVAAWMSAHGTLRSKLAVVDHAPLWEARDPGASRAALATALGCDGPIVLFLGTMQAKQNAAAAAWIDATLADALEPGTTIVLCGPGSEGMGRPAGPGARIVGLGAVDDVDSVVAAADVCIAPLAAGAGVKTKVLHYLAHGRVVAGTPVAFEGLEGAPGLHTASLDEFPSLVRRLCAGGEDEHLRTSRQAAQAGWLDEHHGNAHIAQQWREVFGCLAS